MNSTSQNSLWQFWIDVGGTFTDCLAVSPAGDEQFIKVLSSGLIKASVDRLVDSSQMIVSGLPESTDNFWRGATITLFDDDVNEIASGTIESFESATGLIGITHPAFDHLLNDSLPNDSLPNDSLPNDSLPNDQWTSSEKFSCEINCDLLAPVLAIHLIQNIPINQPLVDCWIDLGTTRGTNALLTRTGERTALVTSRGFRDFLRIGDQARPNLFELDIIKPLPIFQAAIEIRERVLHDGTVELKPDAHQIRQQLQSLKESGIDSLAICLMHSYKFPEHERIVGEIAAEIGFQTICRSSDIAPLIKIVPRGETTVLDAYLNPVIADYLDEIQTQVSADSRLRFMTSAGGLVSRARFSGKDSVLSGPAGGVVGAARIAAQVGFDAVIGFDMGGTSTDVSRFDGEFERSFESRKSGVRIVTPMLEIETVAAGGGSICWFDGSKLRVGPDSAGADPGPACYGRGGPLAITDLNFYLGRLQEDLFPFELDRSDVSDRLSEVCQQLIDAGYNYTTRELAQGFLNIANHNMSAAIQSVSVGKGYDPEDYVLMSFGGAGSQHCCAVAENLGMKKILDHPRSSILSAVGIRMADQSAHAVESVLQIFQQKNQAIFESILQRLAENVTTALVKDLDQSSSDRTNSSRIKYRRSLDMRYVGTEPSLSIDQPNDGDYLAAFFEQHKQHFGYLQQHDVEVVAARVEAIVPGHRLESLAIPKKFELRTPEHIPQKEFELPKFNRDFLNAGDLIGGPALISNRNSNTFVENGWSAKVLSQQILILEKDQPEPNGVPDVPEIQLPKNKPADAPDDDLPNPVRLEIFNNHFSSIARQMGEVLQRTSVSVNVKERLDFSCAIFTGDGDLVVNAPHIPVHLGAMSETVRSIIRLNPAVNVGDVFVTNDPYAGGSHLPDVTVVTPVFESDDDSQRDTSDLAPIFWVASRSHHAEIGGCAPGSMPANATTLGEEGVLIQNLKLLDQGDERFDELFQILTNSPFPSRSPDENIADVRAQVAANQTGLNQLLKLTDRYSTETVVGYMQYIQAAAERKTRTVLRDLPDGEFVFSDALDNGATIRVRLLKEKDELTIDFAGTDPVTADNLNANRAIVSAATMYVMRLLIDEDIPLNEGVMNPVSILLPVCFLNPTPASNRLASPAIVGGNVETSQRVVDVLLGALNLAAASQGTMNNWLMGSDSFGYYETIGGGSGATHARDGADAVHTHMTNTRLTDPEVLESRYPVVLREFSIRRDSGGAGRHRGGDGMVREFEFREPLTVSLLTSRRVTRPYGIDGGSPGNSGRNLLLKLEVEGHEELPPRCEIKVSKGDRLRIETPGGGGCGG